MYTLDINYLFHEQLVKIFPHPVGCYFVQMMVYFTMQKFLSFMRFYLLIIYFSAYAKSVPFRKSFLMPMSLRQFPIFSSIRFSTFGFMLRFEIYLELSFVQGDNRGSILILLHASSLTKTICLRHHF